MDIIDEIHKMSIVDTIDFTNQLLNPLNCRLVVEDNYYVDITDCKTNSQLLCHCNSYSYVTAFKDVKLTLEFLVGQINHFSDKLMTTKIDNPYKGSTSLTECIIKKDLLNGWR